MKGPALAGLLLLLWTAAAAGSDRPDAGRDLYNGVGAATATVSMGGAAALPATRFACRACHGRNGAGGREGAAPPIRASDLFHATLARPAYDTASLKRALAEGRAADGRVLASLMPRYAMDDATFASLAAYLERLAGLQRRGVHPRAVTLAVAVPPDNAATARRYADALRAALDDLLGGRPVHGRTVGVTLLAGDTAAILEGAEDAVAVVGLAPSARLDVAAFTDRQVPVLFPLFPLAGGEDATVVRGLMADRQDALAAIAARLASDKVTAMTAIDAPGCGGQAESFARRYAATGVRYTLSVLPLSAKAPHDVLLLCPDRQVARRVLHGLPDGLRIYGLAGELLSSAEAGRHHLVLASPEALLVSRDKKANLVDVHAAAAARLLVSALKSAGRNLDRTGLVAAVDAVSDPERQLDYAADTLNGTAFVPFIETKPR
ncbi:MAG: hypothetical protein J0H80_05990 [Rhizobiales bacterium]|nr:hypothetical protein [Hyphomicrobiales bacterium]